MSKSIGWCTEETVGLAITNPGAVVRLPLSEYMTEEQRIELWGLIDALNADPEDNNSERYFPIFDLVAKINCGGLGKASKSITVSERHWTAYQKYLTQLSFDYVWLRMEDWFKHRTETHIRLVRKYLQKIIDLNFENIDNEVLEKEKISHDAKKWVYPEYVPYVHLTWKYHTALYGIKYEMPIPMKPLTTEATWHHVKKHEHHPEFWDDNASMQVINSQNRDEPSGQIVDATKMPMTYIAAMLADWLAMGEEKDSKVEDWIKKNVNIRWKFTQEQVNFMHEILGKI